MTSRVGALQPFMLPWLTEYTFPRAGIDMSGRVSTKSPPSGSSVYPFTPSPTERTSWVAAP